MSTAPEQPALGAAAGLYRGSLPPGRLDEMSLAGYDRTGVPTVATTWHSAADPGLSVGGVGYGATDLAATVGALGELVEEVLVGRQVLSLLPRTASYAQLLAERGADRVADPLTLVLPAGCDYTPDRPLDWVPAVRWRTGEEVLVPVEFAAPGPGWLRPGGSVPLITPITNGLGAGDTVERAVSHGLLELVQRDGNTVSYRALDTGVVLDLTELRDPVTRGLLDLLRSREIFPLVKLASTEFAVVVHVVAADADPATSPIAVSAVGEAAHPDRELAVRKAVLEFAASRVRRAFAFGPLAEVRRRHPEYLDAELAVPLPAQEPRALAAMTEWTRLGAAQLSALLAPTVLSQRTVVPFGELPTVPVEEPAALLELMLDRLADFDVLVVPVVGAGAQAVKVLVPGLEVETMSYLRIGERVLRRLLERERSGAHPVHGQLVGLGTPSSPDQLPVLLTAAATERVGGPAWLSRSAVTAAVGDLYPLYREPSRHAPQRLAG